MPPFGSKARSTGDTFRGLYCIHTPHEDVSLRSYGLDLLASDHRETKRHARILPISNPSSLHAPRRTTLRWIHISLSLSLSPSLSSLVQIALSARLNTFCYHVVITRCSH